MEIKRTMIKILRDVTLFLLLFLVGCAPRIYIDSQIDPAYNFLELKQRSYENFLDRPTLHIFPSKDLNLTEKNFRNLLMSELLKQNFKVVDVETVEDLKTVEFLLIFYLGEKTSRVNSHLVLPDWRTTTGNIDGLRFKATEYGTKTVPYSYDINVRGIGLALYVISGDKINIIWEGFTGMDAKDYDKYPEFCVRKLLEYCGSNFRGYVPIDIYSK